MSFQSLLIITEKDTMNTGIAKRLLLCLLCSSLSCHMSAGATLQNYNNDLVACIEEVRAPSHRPRTPRDQGLRLTCRNAHAPGWPWTALTSHGALASLASSSQLREKREELNRSIAADEEEKGASSPSPHRRCAQSSCVSLL